MLKLFAHGFEFVTNGMESLVFEIAKGFGREAVADIVLLFMGLLCYFAYGSQYARLSALCPAGIRASALAYFAALNTPCD